MKGSELGLALDHDPGASRIMRKTFTHQALSRSRIVPRAFYARGTVRVAKDLLGKRLVRIRGRGRMVGEIVEVEAYRGSDDPASHAFRGLTPRNAPMFGEAGHAYVYFTYGNHYCLNITTRENGMPGAVLIRAIEPTEGISTMARLRPKVPKLALTNGPGKLTKALGIDKSLNEIDMTKHGPLYVTRAQARDFEVGRSSRIGIAAGKDRLWRFYILGNPYVSRRQTAEGSQRRRLRRKEPERIT
jgi:DNA-3-methyladenine glycosylase